MNFIKKSLLALTLMTSIAGNAHAMQQLSNDAITSTIGYIPEMQLLNTAKLNFLSLSQEEKDLILCSATKANHVDNARKAINLGANVNWSTPNTFTPLHSAACGGYLESAQLLLENGADVNAKDDRGNTPLHTAACMQHFEVAQLLLEHGADVNAKNNKNRTPLHVDAGERNIIKIVSLLVAYDTKQHWKQIAQEDPQVAQAINQLREKYRPKAKKYQEIYNTVCRIPMQQTADGKETPPGIAQLIADYATNDEFDKKIIDNLDLLKHTAEQEIDIMHTVD